MTLRCKTIEFGLTLQRQKRHSGQCNFSINYTSPYSWDLTHLHRAYQTLNTHQWKISESKTVHMPCWVRPAGEQGTLSCLVQPELAGHRWLCSSLFPACTDSRNTLCLWFRRNQGYLVEKWKSSASRVILFRHLFSSWTKLTKVECDHIA